MQTTRRQFIQSGLGSLVVMALSPGFAVPATTIPIGFQLFTVRGEFARDVPGTLKTLGQIGYKGVEFWDYAGTPNVYQKYSAVGREAKAKRSRLAQPKLAVILPLPQFLAIF